MTSRTDTERLDALEKCEFAHIDCDPIDGQWIAYDSIRGGTWQKTLRAAIDAYLDAKE